MKNLAAIIPFYNEKDFLEISLKRVTDLGIFDQIILTDDCSNDGSSEIALNLASSNPIIEYINGTSNSGKGKALNNAKHLIKTSHVIIHDADLEYFPDDIVEMFNLVEDNPESLILGSRFIGTKDRKNVYFRTNLANRTMSLFFSLVNFQYITDIATCYKLMPTSFFKDLNIKEKGFSIEVELLSKFLKTNRNIIEVPIKYEGRSYTDGKKIKASDGFKYLFNTVKYRFFN
ncbi:MAG: glycosyltransferase family 2 protein [Candidatus Actinomarina sp.]